MFLRLLQNPRVTKHLRKEKIENKEQTKNNRKK